MRSIAAYAFLTLYTVLLGPPVLLLAWALSSEGLIVEAGMFGTAVALKLAGVRYELRGAVASVCSGGAVYCVNHASYLDLASFMALYRVCPGIRVLYKAEFDRVPLLGLIFRMAGCIPIERKKQDLAFEAVDRGVDALKRGASVLAAPEGTRSRDGALAAFKKGVFVMAIRAQVPVVPVAIDGARQALPKGAWRMRPSTITVTIGEPVPTAGLAYDDRSRVAEQVRARIAAMLPGRLPARGTDSAGQVGAARTY
ncbi:MAG: lysophospholipid acyltransferase family protein [Vicinamibacterales bacterium]